MISKIYRLKEKEVKKVLLKGKPFFSYSLVLNQIQNKENFNRFAIIIGGKSVNNNITRNFFRRLFYNSSKNFIENGEKHFFDSVVLLKKQIKLDKKDKKSILNFAGDLDFVLKKAFKKEDEKEIKTFSLKKSI
ncbi:MAG: hypothetical protein PHR68_00175 [Candidatus Gracilibacteria bacterium]|nr:hypothetical protein [Candidatus Gracilibacteria bacterium]